MEADCAIASEVPESRDLGQNLLSWVLGCFMVYMALFGLGHVLLGPFWKGDWIIDGGRDLRRRSVLEYPAQQLE